MASGGDTADEAAPPPTDVVPDEALEGEIVPSGARGPDPAGCGRSMVAAGGLAAVIAVVAASAARETPPAPPRRPKRRRRRKPNPGPAHGPGAAPRLPKWLEDLDRVGENTLVQDRRLTAQGWEDVPTDGDAIVFLGYVVRRKTAADAAMALGNEALLGLALRKKGYGEIDPGFFSSGVKPVARFDVAEPARLTAMLGDKLGGMPLWDRELYQQQEANLRARIGRIIADRERRISSKEAEIEAARDAIRWGSKRRKVPGWSDYLQVESMNTRSIERLRRTIEEAAAALAELELGKRSPAVEFLHAHETY